jgi:transcriptional regulator with XRE-family HTH domain
MGHCFDFLVGIGKTNVSRYENGITFPNINTLSKMVNALGVEINYFYVTPELERQQSAEDKERADYINKLTDNIGQLSTNRLIEALEIFKIWLKIDSQNLR